MEEAFRLAYRAHLRDEDELAESTIYQYDKRIDVWERLLGKPIEEIATSSDDVRTVKNMRDRYSSSYRKGLVSTIHSVHAFGALQGRWKQNGVMLVKTPREENNSPPPLPEDQVLQILRAARTPAEIRATHLGWYGGLRIGESAMIRDDHWLPGRLWFRREKTRKLVEVPIHPQLQLARRVILSCEPHGPSVLQYAKEAIEQRTGIDFVLHQLRKSCSQAMLNRGVPWITVQHYLGHSLGVGGVYAEPTSQMLQEAASTLPF